MEAELSLKLVTKHLVYAGVFILGFVGLPVQAYVIFGVLIVLDTLTGMTKVAVIEGGHSVTSVKIGMGVLRKLLVVLIPVTVALAGKGAGIPLNGLANGALSLLILAEAYSIIGNVHAIAKREDAHEFDAVNWVLTKLKKIIENKLENDNHNHNGDSL